MNIQEGLMNLWNSTGIVNFVLPADPNITNGFEQLLHMHGQWIMILICLFLLWLGIKKQFEPLLLVPIAFGMLLVNIYPDIMAEPYVDAMGIEHAGGLLYYFYVLDEWSILP